MMLGTVESEPVVNGCRVCGWATLPGSVLCVGCLDIREWSRVNRAFCDLLHRELMAEADPDEDVAPVTVVDFALIA